MSASKDEKTEEPKDEKKKKKEKNLIPTKVIVRRLPPGMTENEFREIAAPLPDHDYFRYVFGDRTLHPNNFCRVYINFTNLSDIFPFRDKFDGLELEKNDIRSQCIVEYSPFQKVPKKFKKKEDAKANTIEQDPEYVKFVESLEDEGEKNVLDVEKYLEELDKRDKHTAEVEDTPLTAFIKQKREERKKLREDRKRLDIERRKKKDEERRRRRELERKKRIESEKSKKKKEVNGTDDPKKKTLAETMRDGDRSRPLSGKATGDEDGKMKILQKDSGDQKKLSLSKDITAGVYSHLDLEKSWVQTFDLEWPELHQNSAGGKTDGKESRKFQTLKESAPPRHREDDKAGKNLDGEKKDELKHRGFNKKPDRQIYRPGSPRGRGGGGPVRPGSGRGGSSRPQKYSEQRNRNSRKSESSDQ